MVCFINPIRFILVYFLDSWNFQSSSFQFHLFRLGIFNWYGKVFACQVKRNICSLLVVGILISRRKFMLFFNFVWVQLLFSKLRSVHFLTFSTCHVFEIWVGLNPIWSQTLTQKLWLITCKRLFITEQGEDQSWNQIHKYYM